MLRNVSQRALYESNLNPTSLLTTSSCLHCTLRALFVCCRTFRERDNLTSNLNSEETSEHATVQV